MSAGFLAACQASRPALWRAILASNAAPADRVDPAAADAARAALPEEDAAGLLAWLASRPARRAGPEGMFWDYAEESRRLALLDAGILAILAGVAGAAIHARDIARVLKRDEVLALRRDIGEEMVGYALHRGIYQAGGTRRVFSGLDRGLPLGRRCRLHGAMAVRMVSRRWPEELRTRSADRLPPLPEEGVGEPEADADVLRGVWLTVKKLLIREVVPAWAPCFD